jgi:hypothetical protein
MAILDDELGILNVREWPGVTAGSLANNTQRNNNRIAIQAAIDHCNANDKMIWAQPGDYEIYGGALIIDSATRWLGSMGKTRIIQHQLNAPTIHFGPPLGTLASTVEQVLFDGACLRYAGTATAGGHSVEGNGLFMNNIMNLEIGDRATLATRTSVPWMGVYFDQLPGTTPCFSNKFSNIRITHFGYIGWSQFRDGYESATGNHWSNIYIAGGNGEGQQDLSTVDGMGMYLGSLAQSEFSQLNFEWFMAPKAIHLEVCKDVIFDGVNFEGISLKAGAEQEMGLINQYIASSRWSGVTVNNCKMFASNNLTSGSVFRCGPDAAPSVDGLTVMLMDKVGATFDVFRHMSGSGDAGIHANLDNLSLGDGDLVDRVESVQFSDGNDGALFGRLGDFNNGTPFTMSNASATHYCYRTPAILRMAPSGGNKTITLSRSCTASITARIPRGTVRRVYNVTGSASNIVVANYNAATIGTVTAGNTLLFAFDGDNWVAV